MNYCKLLLLTAIIGFSTPIFSQNIVINEFMASNDSLSGIVDEFGETDDWVELHNLTNTTIDISGYGLSDDYTLLDKWVFPSGIFIPANGYLIVWTDNDDEQGSLHTNYKLNSSGERIVLSNTSNVVLDSISYGNQETNVSMARIPNGTGPFIQQAPTFNANNDGVFVTEYATKSNFKIYPTLATSELFIENNQEENQVCQLVIYTLDGKKLIEKNEVMTSFSLNKINIAELNKGSYFLSIQSKENAPTNFYFQKQ